MTTVPAAARASDTPANARARPRPSLPPKGPAARRWNSALAHPAYVGTFHKTGTIMMHRVLTQLCATMNWRFWSYSHAPEPQDGWEIAFEDHARFVYPGALVRQDFRAAIIVRDPRDVVISGAHYHVWSEEPWLHKPRPGLGGRTYQEAIGALESERERLVFEMKHCALNTVSQMLHVPWDHPHIARVRYEDLVGPDAESHYRALFVHLGVPDDVMDSALDVARRNFLSSKRTQSDRHVRSGRPEEWREVYDADLTATFRAILGDAPEQLGYPPF